MNKLKEKIFVGMSGGVDSSVSALLLKKAGYDVAGVFIKAWHPEFIPCNWRDEMRDAMRVCAKLKIPFLLCDLEEEYKKNVVDYLINEYRIGRTPNPDVLCNKTIKFGAFLDWAIKNGADKIATGHYAQKKVINANDVSQNDYGLFLANDQNKDQTYFLWTLNENQINKSEFPIGHLNKNEVRRIASRHNLHVSEKKDSQGLCFIGQVDMKNFLRRFIVPSPGKIINEEGVEVGIHDGVELYTLGERHGLNISQNKDNTKPYYIAAKNLETKTLIVSNNKANLNPSANFVLQNINFIPNQTDFIDKITAGLNIQIRIRHRGELIGATLYKQNSDYILKINNKNIIIAPGQSVVFYTDNRCLGGAVVSNNLV